MNPNTAFYKYQPINCKINISPFILGIARLFDFTGLLNKPGEKTIAEIDKEALLSDWQAVAEDFYFILSYPDLDEKIKQTK